MLIDLLDVRDAANLISLPDGAILLPQMWIACLPKFVKAWEETRSGVLVSLLHGLSPSSSTADIAQSVLGSADLHPIAARIRSAIPCLPLLHPSALFWCNVCMSIVPGIVAMSHACCYGRGGEDSREILTHLNATLDGTYSQPVISSDSDGYLYKKTLIAFSEGVLPWSHDSLHGCLPIVRSILRACGVVVDDLLKELRNVETVRLACKICCRDSKCVLGMGWLRAVSHAFEAHGGQEGSWVMLPPRLVEKVKNTEYAARKPIAEDTHFRARWECSRCTWEQPEAGLAYTWAQLVMHFTHFHPFTDLNQTWYRASQDSPPFMHPAVLLVERSAQIDDMDQDDEDASFPRKHLVIQAKLPADTWMRLFK
ncbi:hypothetical protein LXA43DRAFT_1100432 [Ganoderma leucocontextum]|nr:hypothetical protein LXA43DRAFT_1100432 [Ganoderma leucocontextum]